MVCDQSALGLLFCLKHVFLVQSIACLRYKKGKCESIHCPEISGAIIKSCARKRLTLRDRCPQTERQKNNKIDLANMFNKTNDSPVYLHLLSMT